VNVVKELQAGRQGGAGAESRREKLQRALEQCMEPEMAAQVAMAADEKLQRENGAGGFEHSPTQAHSEGNSPTQSSQTGMDSSRSAPADPSGVERGQDGLFHGQGDVGAVVKVYSYRYDAFYQATVVGYDTRRRMHCCMYDDGEKQWHDLHHKSFELAHHPADNPRVDGDAEGLHCPPITHATSPVIGKAGSFNRPDVDAQSEGTRSSRSSSKSRPRSRGLTRSEAAATAAKFMKSPYLQDPSFVKLTGSAGAAPGSRGSRRAPGSSHGQGP